MPTRLWVIALTPALGRVAGRAVTVTRTKPAATRPGPGPRAGTGTRTRSLRAADAVERHHHGTLPRLPGRRRLRERSLPRIQDARCAVPASLSAAERRPRAASTDEQGRYQITGLPAGTYTVSAAKSGFVDGAFGQRRPSGPGTSVELTDGQQAANIDIKLARGGVVTGHVLDEQGEPLARAMVTVLRQQYVRGQKQLTPAGTDQSDDRGQYRVFGLPPGDYFVSATAGGIEQAVGD